MRSGCPENPRLPVPVVVVGNVVVGGAGKTPTVLALVQHLKAQGWRPGVVSRGYGRQGTEPLEVLPDTPTQMSGDEPALIRQQSGVPVFVARQRAEAARALLAHHPEVNLILCDDGLQHLALGRDLAIAVFDDRGIGNGWLLPAGLLREPWPVTRRPFRARPGLAPDRPGDPPHRHTHLNIPSLSRASVRWRTEALNALGERRPLELRWAHPTAIAGIARPEAFFYMLRTQGGATSRPWPCQTMPTHRPTRQPAERAYGHRWLCTEKDAVKLFELARRRGPATAARVWATPLQLQVEPAFFAAVDKQPEISSS